MRIDTALRALPPGFSWLNPPAQMEVGESGLTISSSDNTDFWQRTHYGFRRDTGHALLTPLQHDFTLTLHTDVAARHRFDQAGVLARVDADNWIKLAVEREDERLARLGSVVTRGGYSDWASFDVSAERSEFWYRLSRRGSDFLLEHSSDGRSWAQVRVCHLAAPDGATVQAGLYACSPTQGGFAARFGRLMVEDNLWLTRD